MNGRKSFDVKQLAYHQGKRLTSPENRVIGSRGNTNTFATNARARRSLPEARRMKLSLTACLFVLASLSLPLDATAQTPPPAPALVEPAAGASLLQPMTLRWSAVADPDGPIGSYTWQVGTSSTFSVVIAAGFTDSRDGESIPTVA